MELKFNWFPVYMNADGKAELQPQNDGKGIR